MRIAILWTHASGYSAACWRDLQATDGITLKVWAYSSKETASNAPFDEALLLEGIDCVLLDARQAEDFQFLERAVCDYRPDVVLVSGWSNRAYRKLMASADLKCGTKIMGMDNPWSGTWKQYATCWLRNRYVKRFDYIWVAGERTRQFAKRISRTTSIRDGVYSFDSSAFSGSLQKRRLQAADWPKRFLYVGRYVESKGLRQLLKAYDRYRRNVTDPWELHCCGAGPLEVLFGNRVGVRNLGFCQPRTLPNVFDSAGVFILPSRYEPWGVVVAEAMAAGLPVIASDACGATVELVRDNYNGFVFDPSNGVELLERMLWCHDNRNRLFTLSQNAIASASAFSSGLWAERLVSIVRRKGTGEFAVPSNDCHLEHEKNKT